VRRGEDEFDWNTVPVRGEDDKQGYEAQ
jgi:hypothetical protein